MDITDLVKLTSRAWSLDILAALHLGTPGRQAALIAATGARRTALSQSLTHLIDTGVIERNPGHGHPLRPEYRLTAPGIKAAALAHRILDTLKNDAGMGLVRRTWTLPLISVTGRPMAFSAMRARLAPITDRSLSQNLKSLTDARWITRDVATDLTPPRPYYRAVNTGARLNDLLTAT